MRIAFVLGKMAAGPRPIDWGHLWSADRGLTGSEAAIVALATEMALRGHGVQVFAIDPNKAYFKGRGTVAPLELLQNARPGYEYDVIYSWMDPRVFPDDLPVHVVRAVNQQLNDFTYLKPGFAKNVDVWTSPAQHHLDHVLKNKWPASEGPAPTDQWHVLPNGCWPDEYRQRATVPGRCIYMSSPDRGLHLLLQEWPKIRRRVPSATLRIFYWSLRTWCEHHIGIEESPFPDVLEQAYRARYIDRALLHAKELGIEVVGSISREQMRVELSQAAVLAYPCDPVVYTEGFGSAVLEACAAGVLPVISEADAFKEIYGDHCPMVPAPARDHMAAWTDTVVAALKDEPFRQVLVSRAQQLGAQYAWPKVAERLEGILVNAIAAKKASNATKTLPDVAKPVSLPAAPSREVVAPVGT